jgi:hypothetical protein
MRTKSEINLMEDTIVHSMSNDMPPEDTSSRIVEVRSGFAPVVQAQEVSIKGGGALVIAAGNDIKIMGGGGTLIGAGNDISIVAGGGSVLKAGNNLSVQSGGGAALIANRATLSNSFVGLMLSRKVEMREGSRVLLGTPQAAALGAALGLIFALVGRWFRRK